MGAKRRRARKARHSAAYLVYSTLFLGAVGLTILGAVGVLLRRHSPDLNPASRFGGIRALWVQRESMADAARIEGVIGAMKAAGMNTALVHVRTSGDALYRSSREPHGAGVAEDFDPLHYFLDRAHREGIQVHAWVNTLLVMRERAGRRRLPLHLSLRHPDWFLRRADGASMLADGLARLKKEQLEGAFLDPSLPAVREYTAALLEELASRYPVEGIHLDFIRYPFSDPEKTSEFGADPAGLERLARIEGVSPQDLKADRNRLNRLRSAQVTALVADIAAKLRPRFPKLMLSASVWPDRAKCEAHVFQDWRYWLKEGWLDFAFPMIYTADEAQYENLVLTVAEPELRQRLVLGVGAYKEPSPASFAAQLTLARRAGAAGYAIFDDRWLARQQRNPASGSIARLRSDADSEVLE